MAAGQFAKTSGFKYSLAALAWAATLIGCWSGRELPSRQSADLVYTAVAAPLHALEGYAERVRAKHRRAIEGPTVLHVGADTPADRLRRARFRHFRLMREHILGSLKLEGGLVAAIPTSARPKLVLSSPPDSPRCAELRWASAVAPSTAELGSIGVERVSCSAGDVVVWSGPLSALPRLAHRR